MQTNDAMNSFFKKFFSPIVYQTANTSYKKYFLLSTSTLYLKCFCFLFFYKFNKVQISKVLNSPPFTPTQASEQVGILNPVNQLYSLLNNIVCLQHYLGLAETKQKQAFTHGLERGKLSQPWMQLKQSSFLFKPLTHSDFVWVWLRSHPQFPLSCCARVSLFMPRVATLQLQIGSARLIFSP